MGIYANASADGDLPGEWRSSGKLVSSRTEHSSRSDIMTVAVVETHGYHRRSLRDQVSSERDFFKKANGTETG